MTGTGERPTTPGDVEALGRNLRAQGRRLGHARRRVLEAFEAIDRPATAEELAATIPDVHVSSVYRSLVVLEELGLVSHTHLAHGPALYELGPAASVVHLVCEVCGRDVPVPSEVFDPVRGRIATTYGFHLTAHHFAVVGRCTGCLGEEPAPPSSG